MDMKVLTPPVDYSKTIILDAPQEKVEPKAFTLEELKKFNGVEDPKIYLGVSGKVYDVTAKKNFYGPEGPYGLFAGHDASRALAMGDLSGNTISMEWDTLDTLNSMEKSTLADWVESFDAKYEVVGWLVKEHEPINEKADEKVIQ